MANSGSVLHAHFAHDIMDADISTVSTAQHFLMRQCLSLAGLIILLWDVVICFDDEYKHLWKTPSFLIKRVYFFLRYVPLTIQAISVYSVFGPLSKSPIPENQCLMWFNIQMSFAQICVTLANAVFFLRVYALYNKSYKLAWFLLALFTVDNSQSTAMCIRTQTRLTFDERCAAHDDTHDPYIYTMSVMITQATLWGLTWRKRAMGSRLSVPLISSTIRDGGWVFAGIALVLAFSVPYSTLVEVTSEVVLQLPMIVHSISACRIIINIQKAVLEDASGFQDAELLDFDSELAMHARSIHQ